MDSRRPRPSTGPSSNGGGQFLQGVWMSKCEGGRIERLTKWSDGRKNQKIDSLDQQEHSSMVRINLRQLEVRDELAALKKSRRTPVSGQTSGIQEASSPFQDRKHGRFQDKPVSSSSKKIGGKEETASSRESGKLAYKNPNGMRSLRVGPRSAKDAKGPQISDRSKDFPSVVSAKRSPHPQKTKNNPKEHPTSTKPAQTSVTSTMKRDTEEKPKLVRKLGRVELHMDSSKLLNGMQDHAVE